MKEYSREDIAKRRSERRRRIRRAKLKRLSFLMSLLILLSAAVIGGTAGVKWIRNSLSTRANSSENVGNSSNSSNSINLKEIKLPDYVDVQLIPKGEAREGKKLSRVKYIVVHYVGNPGTSAQNNRDFFAKSDTQVCSHFVVGLNGEIIQCVPLNERSAASNERNKDSISIEVCHPDKSGKFNDATYQSLVKLTALLCDELGLSEENVIRHYDVTGKLCPLYYVNNPGEWDKFRNDIKNNLQGEKQ